MRNYPVCFFILFLFLSFSLKTGAQEVPKVTVAGVVKDADSGESIPYATVVIEELGLWYISEEGGQFHIGNVPVGSYRIRVEILGYETKQFPLKVQGPVSGLILSVYESSLRLQEVVVTAEEGGRLNSSSRIEKQALEHVQPSSIKDVMQLLPGNITENPTLNSVNQLTIRDISTNSANAFGTALILDGATVSNDANLQVRKTSSLSSNGESTAGTGVDARQLSTDNIESIEVIRGIPSVEYGDLTSGAVVVKTRMGLTPWQVRLKADPKLKQVSLSKGFSLSSGEKKHFGNHRGRARNRNMARTHVAGVVNLDADYALSYADIRTPADVYRRFNLQLGYSNTFRKKLVFNAKVRANYSDASNATDPDNFLENISRDTDKGLGLYFNGKYIINKPWITNLEFVMAGDITKQYSQEKAYRSYGRVAHSLAMESGENLGFFTPFQYYSNLEIFGLPVNLQSKLTANLFGRYGQVSNKVLLGVEWTSKGNKGEGKVFDPYLSPDASSSSTFRERSYKDIPFLHRYTAFVEDKMAVPIKGKVLEIQAGVRVNGIVPHEKFSMARYFSAEPRFNARYQVIHRQTGFKELAVRAGWGINYKMPSMVYLYPEPTFLDVVSFSYNDIDDNGVGTVLFTTKRLDNEVRNSLLEMQKSVNIEAAAEFRIGDVWGSLVYYNEDMTNGYGFSTRVMPVEYNRYGYVWENGSPSRISIPSGKLPMYRDGSVYVDGQALPYISDTIFLTYQKPVNNIQQKKWGIEYTLNFPEIKVINTSVSVNGAYMNVKTQDESEGAILVGTQVAGRPYRYAGVYAAGNKTSSGDRKERLNTNIRFITHIPRVGMVVTVTAQMIFMDRTTYVCELNDQVQTYYYDDKGIRHSGKWAYDDDKYTKRVNPLYLIDMKGNVIPFTQEMENDPQYRELIGTTNKASYYLGSRYPVYGILNIRLTKEIGRWATVSFYANNFLNIDQLVTEKISGTAFARNLPLYFGAEVKLTL